MKLFRRRQKNNKGFSLVEVICAVAVLSLATTAIGSAMIASTSSYQRGNAELEVQKEAQTTTNLIGNLLVDSLEATWTVVGSEKKLTIKGESVTYELLYNKNISDEIKYTEKIGASTTSGTLAENVTDFNVDLSKYATDKSAMVEVALERDGKSFEATYNTTSRNGSANSIGAEETAAIIVETDIVLEPGQTYEIPVTVLGMSAAEAGIVWTTPEASALAGSVVGTSELKDASETGAKIYVGPEAKGAIVFTVSTDKKDEAGLPLDTKTVTVYVRRVLDVAVIADNTNSNPYGVGAKYHITATAVGDRLENTGRTFDDGTVKAEYAYKNPKYMDFSITMTGGNVGDYIKVNDKQENVDSPYIDIELLQALPEGSVITITATSKHAEGDFTDVEPTGTTTARYNKTGTDYGPVAGVATIEKVGSSKINFPNGVKRGSDYNGFTHTINMSTIQANFGGQPYWFIRYKVEGGEWTQFYKTHEGGSSQKINADETMLWDADKSVQFEMILTYLNEIGTNADGTKKYEMTWPHDETLLADSMNYGFYEYGIQKGWDDDDLTKAESTSNFNDYGIKYDLGAGAPAYTRYSWTDGVDTNIPIDTFVSHVGVDNSATNFKITKGDSVRIPYDTANIEMGNYDFYSYTEFWNGTSWVDVSSHTYDGGEKYFNIQGNNDDGTHGEIFLSNVTDAAPKGRYRIGLMLMGQKYRDPKFLESNLFELKWTDMKYDKNFKLFNDDIGTEGYNVDGYVYFTIE